MALDRPTARLSLACDAGRDMKQGKRRKDGPETRFRQKTLRILVATAVQEPARFGGKVMSADVRANVGAGVGEPFLTKDRQR